MGYKSDYAVQYLIPISNTRSRRHQQRLKQYPSFQVNAFMNSFFPSVINIWNKLPDSVIKTANISDFKDSLTHDLFNQCNL